MFIHDYYPIAILPLSRKKTGMKIVINIGIISLTFS